MYLSDRDLRWAIESGKLIVEPKPDRIEPTSIDLHLDVVGQAKIWNIDLLQQNHEIEGQESLELRIGKFEYKRFAPKYLMPPTEDASKLIFRRGNQVVVKPGGFLLWQTKEEVGTPEEGADLICFIDGKSTRARTGLLVHLTAPTIHAGWSGPVTLEIANLGPFHFILQEDDVIAQITVAMVSSIPERTMKETGSVTYRQTNVAATSDVPDTSRGVLKGSRSTKRAT